MYTINKTRWEECREGDGIPYRVVVYRCRSSENCSGIDDIRARVTTMLVRFTSDDDAVHVFKDADSAGIRAGSAGALRSRLRPCLSFARLHFFRNASVASISMRFVRGMFYYTFFYIYIGKGKYIRETACANCVLQTAGNDC